MRGADNGTSVRVRVQNPRDPAAGSSPSKTNSSTVQLLVPYRSVKVRQTRSNKFKVQFDESRFLWSIDTMTTTLIVDGNGF